MFTSLQFRVYSTLLLGSFPVTNVLKTRSMIKLEKLLVHGSLFGSTIEPQLNR